MPPATQKEPRSPSTQGKAAGARAAPRTPTPRTPTPRRTPTRGRLSYRNLAESNPVARDQLLTSYTHHSLSKFLSCSSRDRKWLTLPPSTEVLIQQMETQHRLDDQQRDRERRHYGSGSGGGGGGGGGSHATHHNQQHQQQQTMGSTKPPAATVVVPRKLDPLLSVVGFIQLQKEVIQSRSGAKPGATDYYYAGGSGSAGSAGSAQDYYHHYFATSSRQPATSHDGQATGSAAWKKSLALHRSTSSTASAIATANMAAALATTTPTRSTTPAATPLPPIAASTRATAARVADMEPPATTESDWNAAATATAIATATTTTISPGSSPASARPPPGNRTAIAVAVDAPSRTLPDASATTNATITTNAEDQDHSSKVEWELHKASLDRLLLETKEASQRFRIHGILRNANDKQQQQQAQPQPLRSWQKPNNPGSRDDASGTNNKALSTLTAGYLKRLAQERNRNVVMDEQATIAYLEHLIVGEADNPFDIREEFRHSAADDVPPPQSSSPSPNATTLTATTTATTTTTNTTTNTTTTNNNTNFHARRSRNRSHVPGAIGPESLPIQREDLRDILLNLPSEVAVDSTLYRETDDSHTDEDVSWKMLRPVNKNDPNRKMPEIYRRFIEVPDRVPFLHAFVQLANHKKLPVGNSITGIAVDFYTDMWNLDDAIQSRFVFLKEYPSQGTHEYEVVVRTILLAFHGDYFEPELRAECALLLAELGSMQGMKECKKIYWDMVKAYCATNAANFTNILAHSRTALVSATALIHLGDVDEWILAIFMKQFEDGAEEQILHASRTLSVFKKTPKYAEVVHLILDLLEDPKWRMRRTIIQLLSDYVDFDEDLADEDYDEVSQQQETAPLQVQQPADKQQQQQQQEPSVPAPVPVTVPLPPAHQEPSQGDVIAIVAVPTDDAALALGLPPPLVGAAAVTPATATATTVSRDEPAELHWHQRSISQIALDRLVDLALNDWQEQVREAAQHVVQRIGHGKPMIQWLTHSLNATDFRKRAYALRTFCALGKMVDAAMSGFLRCLRDGYTVVRREACKVACSIARNDEELLKALMDLFDDPDWRVRAFSVKGGCFHGCVFVAMLILLVFFRLLFQQLLRSIVIPHLSLSSPLSLSPPPHSSLA